MKYIPRAIEYYIKNTSQSFKAVLITGSRQVGKSTLLKMLYPDIKYRTFDDPLLLAGSKNEPGLFMKNNQPPVILDEVQYATDLFSYIKMECDASEKKGLFFLTGSQQYRLMQNVSESLAGRIAILELSPLSLREIQRVRFNKHFVPTEKYLKARSTEIKHCDNIWKIIHRGCYPEIQNTDVDWQTFYSSYVQTYIERDVNELINIKDKLKFIQFLTAVAARSGQLLNYSAIAGELELTTATIKQWISILETSGLIFILQPYSNSALNRAIKTPKIYFRDTGLLCYLTKWTDAESLSVSAVAGNVFETYVVSEILKSYSNEGLDYNFYIRYYRGKDKIKRNPAEEGSGKESEIDLVIEENGTLYPIEIKLSANPRLSMTDAFDVLEKAAGFKRGSGAVICMYDHLLPLGGKDVAIPVEYI